MDFNYAFVQEHPDLAEPEPERRLISVNDTIRERYGCQTLLLTNAELNALQQGNLLEVSISGGEYTLLIVLEQFGVPYISKEDDDE